MRGSHKKENTREEDILKNMEKNAWYDEKSYNRKDVIE